MSAADIQAKAFTDNDVAREAIEALMWPNGPVCPHCGCTGKIGKVEGKSARSGLYYCGDCKKQFTVTVGTIFERSKVPLSKWWMAIHLMASSKKGMSAHQLHRMLGVAYQTAWFMEHRIRENIDRESHVMTDEASRYSKIGSEFAKHDVVDHSRKEYGYTDRETGAKINTNTIEGYYSIFKRGMKGVYQHCGEKHLHRYLAEFDFRYSNRTKLVAHVIEFDWIV